MAYARTPPEERIWRFIEIDPETSCWLWTGNLGWQGYGQFWNGDKTVRAHRFTYEHFVGPIPDGYTIDHLCRVRRCCNPEHLEPLTIRDNLMRGNTPAAINAAKTHCVHGHELAGSNLGVNNRGARFCRTCSNESSRRSLVRRAG